MSTDSTNVQAAIQAYLQSAAGADLLRSHISAALAPLQQRIEQLERTLSQQSAPFKPSPVYGSRSVSYNPPDSSDSRSPSSNLYSQPIGDDSRLYPTTSAGGRQPIRLGLGNSSNNAAPPASTEGDNVDNLQESDPRSLLSAKLNKRMLDGSADNLSRRPGVGLGLGSGSAPAGNNSAMARVKSAGVGGNSTVITASNSSNPSAPEVILVEDVRVSARIAHAALTRAHYKVAVASDGETAVDLFRANQLTIRVILMDINLPGISGIEATEKIRRIEQETGQQPTLIFGLTGNVDEENLRHYQQAGMNGCILKGKLLVESVQQAEREVEKNPTAFINLANPKVAQSLQAVTPADGAADRASTNQSRPSVTFNEPRLSVAHQLPQSVGSLQQRQNSHPSMQQQHQQPSQSPTQLTGHSSMPLPTFQPGASVPSPGRLPRATSVGSNIELLLVEDVRVSAKIAQAALSRANYRVDVANDGESAVKKYQQHSQSLRIILMDINLPGISGIEATEQIRRLEREQQQQHQVYILGLTGNVDEENLRLYESAGMNGCIMKGNKTLAQSVQTAVTEIESNPNRFVNLATDTSSTAAASTFAQRDSMQQQQQPADDHMEAVESTSAAPTEQYQQPQQQYPQQPQPQPSFSPVSTQQPSLASQFKDDASYANSSVGIGTPRATQPRQLLANKFKERGTTRPGIGLPNASAGSSPGPLDSRMTNSTSPVMSQRQAGNGADCLLVEDVRVSQRIAQQALTRAHYKVVVASDGETAVEQFQNNSSTIRVILMDINLPGISGIEATEKIRRIEQELQQQPVLIFGLTGNVDEENLRSYEAAGMNGCIMKGQVLVESVKEAERQISSNPTKFVNLVGAQK